MVGTESVDLRANLTYIVLVRIKIGWPKKAGTFSSINECVLMKFNVASGSVLESLWHDPGRGSGTWKLQVILKINAYLCNVPKEFSTLQAQLILHLPVRYWRVTNSNLDHFALWNYLQRCQQCPVKGINWNISHENRIIYCLTESKYRIYGKHSSAFSFIWHRQNTIFVWKIKQITETHRCQILAVITLQF